MLRKVLYGAAVLVVLAVLGSILNRYHQNSLAGTLGELKAAQAANATVSQLAAQALSAGAQLKAHADSAERRAAVEKRRGDSLSRVAVDARSRFTSELAFVADTCKPILDLAVAALAADSVEAESLKLQLASSQDAFQSQRLRADTTEDALRRLRVSSAALSVAASNVAHAASPSLLSRLLPHLGFGGAAGVNPGGRPDAVVGVTFGWRV